MFDEYNKVSGIYRITNTLNGKCYIGSAVNLKKRLLQHYNYEKGQSNIRLQHSIKKYGLINFIFEVVQLVEEKEKLIECEQVWIDKYDFKNLYNIAPTAGTRLGMKHSVEALRKIRKAHEKQSKAVYKICKFTGKILGEYKSVREAARIIKIDHSKISKACKEKNCYVANFIWRYTDDIFETEKEIVSSAINKEKPIAQYSIENSELLNIYRNVKEAEEQTGIKYSNITNSARNYNYTAGGYKWEYVTAQQYVDYVFK